MIVVVDEATLSRSVSRLGADDFLLTTASSDEIEARFADRAAGRTGDDATVLKVGDLTVNPENYQVYVHGRPLDLTYKEFELLKFLAQRPGPGLRPRHACCERCGATTTTEGRARWTSTSGDCGPSSVRSTRR